MNQRVGRYLSLIVLLGAVGTVSAITLEALDREPEATVTKVRSASRIIGYQVFRDRGPSFQLRGTKLKLVSNAVVDGYDPLRTTSYGFRLTARNGKSEVWSRDVYLQSRESKARWNGQRWLDESAWGVDPIRLADERIAILDLPDVAANATLSIALLGTPREAVIRLFGQEVRTEAERRAAFVRLDPAERSELIRSSTYVPWQLLSFDEQYARLKQRWVRMAALGDSGFDVTTRMIYVTDFRLPVTPTVSDGVEVARDRDIAINVYGPAHLSLTAVTGAVGDLVIEQRSAAGTRRLGIDERGGLDVDSGPGTLIVRTARSEPVRFRISGPVDAQILSDKARAPLPGELGPDRVNISLAVCGATTPVVVPVRTTARVPLLGRGFRVDARVAVTDQGDSAEPAVASLSVAYVADNGNRLGIDRVIVGGAVSRFEQLVIGGAVTRVSEPTSLRVVAPSGAARIEITSDRDVGLRVFRWAPVPRAVDPIPRPSVGEDGRSGDAGDQAASIERTYRDFEVPEHRWRYAKVGQRSWFPMVAQAADGAETTFAQLQAQVRLEPVFDSTSGLEVADYRTLVPEGRPEKQRARELVPAEELADALTAWPPGLRTRIAVGTARAIDFRSTFASRPRLSWAADPSAVGGELVVTVDDLRIPVAMTSTVGAVHLPRISPGRHRVLIEGTAKDVWIDRPPADGGGGVARDRTLYRLTAEGLRVRVRKLAEESVQVYAIIYAPPSASTATSFVMTVDGGRVTRRGGVTDKLTSAEVRAPMPEPRRANPAVLVDLDGQVAGLPRSMRIGILSDVVGGWHHIVLRRTGTTDVWVRFVTTQARDKPPARTFIWSSGSMPVMERVDAE